MRALAVIALLAILLLAFSAGYGASSRFQLAAETSRPAVCADQKTQDTIRQLMFGALDTALHDHITHTFEVWMKDETGQPTRAKRGVDQGIAAYIRSRNAVATWKLPACQ